MQSYSVMTDPVIPVLMLDGSQREIGIREVFERAHEIADLQCPSPLENYAVFRLLVAIAMDMLRPERWMDRLNMLEAGHFDSSAVDAYIAACEADGPRFDLFDKKHPFMQAAFDPETDDKAVKPIAALSVSLPSGNNHVFWDHRPEAVPVMTPAEAFRSMISLYVFCTAAAQGYPSGVNNTPPVYNRIIGCNLYESMILNMISVRECAAIEYGSAPPWRTQSTVIPKQEIAEVSLLDAFTWQPRRLCLLRDPDGMVRKAALQQGKNFRGNQLWRDPHVAYRLSKSGDWLSVKPQAGRALWRDIGSLLADSASEHYHPPLTVSQAGEALSQTGKPIQIRQIGVITNQASYVSWIEDQLSIPVYLLNDDYLASVIRDNVETVEAVQSILAQVINRHYCHDSKHSSDLAEQARLSFLSEMHDVLFGFCIPNVYQISDSETADALKEYLVKFHHMTEDAIRRTFREVVNVSGTSATDLRLQVESQREVVNKFRKIAAEKEERYE